MVGLATIFGAGGGTSSYAEIEDTDVIILWGSNARDAHPIFFHHVLKGVHAGARLFVVDPRRSPSAQWADLWLGNHVGTDIALAHTIAREIIHAGLANTDFIQRATSGFDQYLAAVEPWTLERGAAVTGVPADAIREVAHAYAAGRPGTVVLDARHHRAPQRRRQRAGADQPGVAVRSRRPSRRRAEPIARAEQRAGRR